METWDDRYDRIQEEIDDVVEPLGLDVVYSAYGKDNKGLPTNNLKEVAVKGKVKIIVEPDDFFGDEKSKGYRSRTLTNPTWLTLFKHSHKAMQRTRDEHHCFFEGFRVISKQDDVTYIELDMGS